MEKVRIIKDIHKVLFVYEDGDYDKYYACLSHQIIKLSEYEDNVIKENVGLLKGLRNMGRDVTHFDVRHTILHVMNEIDREVK